MTTTLRKLAPPLAALSFAICLCGVAPAQNPFDDAPAANPFDAAAAPKTPAAAPLADDAAAAPAPEETDPLVLMIRERDPSTPEEIIHAVALLMKISRYDEAKPLLAKLQAAAPDDAALAALQRRFGSALFVRMVRQEELHPEGLEVAENVLRAADQAARNIDHLRSLAANLSHEDRAVRKAALVDLHEAGFDAVAALVEVLADDSRSDEHANVQQALVDLKPEATVDPLIAWLNAPNDALKIRVMEVLERIGERRSGIYLFRPMFADDSSDDVQEAARSALAWMFTAAPDRRQAINILHDRVHELHDGAPLAQPDHENMLQIWVWDEATAAPVRRRLPAKDAAHVVEAQLAADLYAIAPEFSDSRKLHLTTRLEAAKILGGLDQPLQKGAGTAHDAALAEGVAGVEEMLTFAADTNHAAAAMAAAEVLGSLADPAALHGKRGLPGPLAKALTFPDRRVRFAAATAILQIDPKFPYPGAALLADELGYFASATGAPRVLIGDPLVQKAQSLAGLFLELGYEADTASSGAGLLRAARLNPDYEVIMVSEAIDAPAVNELLQLLRRDWRTASIPIGVISREERDAYANRLAEDDPLTAAVPPAVTTPILARQVERLLELPGRYFTPVDERLAQAVFALDALGRIAAAPEAYVFYDVANQREVVRRALYTPELSARAADVMGLLGDAAAQRELVEFASQPTRDLALRQAAAAAFDNAVRRRGLWLTQSQILQQYDRYNRSAQLDKDTQAVLSGILDSIEAPTKKTSVKAQAAPQETPTESSPSTSS